jgi:membrane fusion protein
MSDLFRQEVIAEQPNRLHGHIILQLPLSTKLLVAALVACIVAAAVWVTTGEYARTQTVRGMLVTTEPSVKIFPQRPGRVAQFALTEGQEVVVGQLLAVVNTDIVSESGTATADFSSAAVDERLGLANRRADMSLENAAAERTQLQAQIASISRQIDSLRGQITLQQEIVRSNRLMFERVEEIIDRGFISQFDYERRRQNMLASEQNLSNLQQTLERLESERANVTAELGQSRIVTQQELTEIGSAIASLGQEKAQFEGQRSYVIRAPIAGRVTAIQTAEGRHASGETPLLVIVPHGAKLRARLYAPSTAIGMVEPGQHATLLLDAFPYQRFGSADARIVDISRTVLDPRDADVPFAIEEPVYQIDAELERQSIEAFGGEVSFQPGMTLKANIVLERQSFLDWLLQPLNAVLNRT